VVEKNQTLTHPCPRKCREGKNAYLRRGVCGETPGQAKGISPIRGEEGGGRGKLNGSGRGKKPGSAWTKPVVCSTKRKRGNGAEVRNSFY